MSGGDGSVGMRRKQAEYLRSFGLVVVGALIMFLILESSNPLRAEWISIVYPIDKNLLIVERRGETRLAEGGDLETAQAVRREAFDIDRLFQELLGKLVDTWDADQRIGEPVAVIRIGFNNETSGTYHIYDAEYAEELFARARDNLVGQRP